MWGSAIVDQHGIDIFCELLTGNTELPAELKIEISFPQVSAVPLRDSFRDFVFRSSPIAIR